MKGLVLLTTLPDVRTAHSLAILLVREKVAACVSAHEKSVSFYRWKGKVEKSEEVQLFIKTSKKHFAKVCGMIRSVHPYDLPEMIALPIVQGSPEYLKWLQDSLK